MVEKEAKSGLLFLLLQSLVALDFSLNSNKRMCKMPQAANSSCRLKSTVAEVSRRTTEGTVSSRGTEKREHH